MLYLSSTNRAFLKAPSTNERVETTTKALEDVRVKLSAVGILKNTVYRDEELSGRSSEYWRSEVRIIREAMEDREVVEGVNNARKFCRLSLSLFRAHLSIHTYTSTHPPISNNPQETEN